MKDVEEEFNKRKLEKKAKLQKKDKTKKELEKKDEKKKEDREDAKKTVNEIKQGTNVAAVEKVNKSQNIHRATAPKQK